MLSIRTIVTVNRAASMLDARNERMRMRTATSISIVMMGNYGKWGRDQEISRGVNGKCVRNGRRGIA
jgi:hypothetical protein